MNISDFPLAGTINGMAWDGWRRAELSEIAHLARWLPAQVLDSPLGLIGTVAGDLVAALNLPETPKGVLGDPVLVTGVGTLKGDPNTCIIAVEILIDPLEEDYATIFRTVPRNGDAIDRLEYRWEIKHMKASHIVELIDENKQDELIVFIWRWSNFHPEKAPNAANGWMEDARAIVDNKIDFTFTCDSPEAARHIAK